MSKFSELPSSDAFDIILGYYRLRFIGTLAAWHLISCLGRRSIFLGGFITMCVVIFAMAFAALASTSSTASTREQPILVVG